jgi:hypothetical protein
MGFLIELLLFHPAIAVLQAGVGIRSPGEHPRVRRLQRLTAGLALLGACAASAGLLWRTLGVSPTVGAAAGILGYVLLVLAGLAGEAVERRLWPDEGHRAG